MTRKRVLAAKPSYIEEVRLRSLDALDLQRSWKRVLHGARETVMDVPDRLPFEVLSRYWEDVPRLDAEHDVQHVHAVMATKPGGSTVRPFVRLHPRDLLLYQALVDAARVPLEAALPPPDRLFSYRLSALNYDDPFHGSPRWRDFRRAVQSLCTSHPRGYVIHTDVASYFLGIEFHELERRLLEIGVDSRVARDLTTLLETLHSHGVAGLPQGVPPSSPLGNLYLRPLDGWLEASGLPFLRYMDDLYVACDTHHEARRALDAMEAVLYEDGLSLGGAKTSIRRAFSVLADMTSPDEELDEATREMLEFADEYGPSDEDIEEWRLDQVRDVYDNAVEALGDDKYLRHHLTSAIRQFTKQRDPHGLEKIPEVLLRMPGLTPVACGYLEKMIGPAHRDAVRVVLETLIVGRFHRTQEWFHVLRIVQMLPKRGAAQLVDELAAIALDQEQHPLVRARAVLAWGAQSAADRFDVADRFFLAEKRTWRPYAVVAIQHKEGDERDARYERWSREGRGLAWLACSVQRQPFGWSKI